MGGLRGSRVVAPMLLAALSWLLGSGCKPSPGGSCDGKSIPVCYDPRTVLTCTGGKWQASTCRGPDGCAGPTGLCDSTLAKDGDGCLLEGDYSCSTDNQYELRCSDGKWATTRKCAGRKGCGPRGLFCDTPTAEAGGTCVTDEKRPGKNLACSARWDAVLACKGGSWKAIEQCREGCYSNEAMQLQCHEPVAKEGDLCDSQKDEQPTAPAAGGKSLGNYVCSTDGKAMLGCEKDAWKVLLQCRGAAGCSTSGRGAFAPTISCDTSVVAPGEACEKEGQVGCSTDNKTVLKCKNGKFEKETVCPRACRVSWRSADSFQGDPIADHNRSLTCE